MAATAPKGQTRGPHKGGRRNENNRIYGNPLPIVLIDPPNRLRSVLGLVGLSLARVETPHCTGIFDPATRSVWVSDPKDALLLWQRGFFGKGDLSRSEPSWLARQINIRRSGGKKLTSEEVTAKRRAERKQFKLDRAAAIAAVLAEAEVAFDEGRGVMIPQLSGPNIPSGATWKPAKPSANDIVAEAPTSLTEDNVQEEEETLEDVEHLQLSLPEAWFLLWNLDCLTVLDHASNAPMTLAKIWESFQLAHVTLPMPIPASLSSPMQDLQPDSPFLINSIVYQHYRSLGWVVKGGIKFCVDYLIYKRGPVFTHAEFAIVVCPVYEDPEDQACSSVDLPNATPFSWTWLSTINRVNSQAQKTLILAYVTIPARSRLSPGAMNSPAVLAQYSVREVIVRRFIPARMRD